MPITWDCLNQRAHEITIQPLVDAYGFREMAKTHWINTISLEEYSYVPFQLKKNPEACVYCWGFENDTLKYDIPVRRSFYTKGIWE